MLASDQKFISIRLNRPSVFHRSVLRCLKLRTPYRSTNESLSWKSATRSLSTKTCICMSPSNRCVTMVVESREQIDDMVVAAQSSRAMLHDATNQVTAGTEGAFRCFTILLCYYKFLLNFPPRKEIIWFRKFVFLFLSFQLFAVHNLPLELMISAQNVKESSEYSLKSVCLLT